MTNTEVAREVLRATGGDRLEFLQGLVTNDLARLSAGPIYAALLNPQGKYLADFFLVDDPDGVAILLDVDAALAPALLQRLTMYRLRADVRIVPADLCVQRGLGPCPKDAHADPRDPAMGWRRYAEAPAPPSDPVDWDALRVAHAIPASGIELIPDETYILEAGFERLHGVDFRKGCYVGQEVTARMKHKTELRKGLARVTVEGAAPVGTAIAAAGKTVGTLFTQSNGAALAHLRFDRAGPDMRAGEAKVGWLGQARSE